MRSFILLFGLCSLLALSRAWHTKFQVQSIPQVEKVENQFTGKVSLNDKYNSSMFYWLVRQSEPSATSPVLFWLNGGHLIFASLKI